MTSIARSVGGAVLAALIGLGPFWMGPATAQDGARSCHALVQALAKEGRTALTGVNFDFNRASLRPDSLPALIAARDAILTLGGAWQIEGHTDNRGGPEYNKRLSESRALAVRDWLVAAGVPPDRLVAQGYSFDRPMADNATDEGRARNRRVELAGKIASDKLSIGAPDGADPCPDRPAGSASATKPGAATPPKIVEWTGSGGQEYLPFSYLMATAMGGTKGWAGNRITMPPGTQPQTCQARCQAEKRCAAFSFEPAGMNFVETASCALIGYGTEVNLRRDNTYYDGGTFTASGLKPDARLLTPESKALAQQILDDMAEIAALRASVRIIAPESHVPEAQMNVRLEGGVPPARYRSFVEIADLGDYAFDWRASKSSLFTHDMADSKSGEIGVPATGDYVLRYVIDHPTAGRHSIVDMPLSVRAGAAAVSPAQGAAATRTGTIEPGVDRPGHDIAQTPLTVADPKACQAICAADSKCRVWTYVNPGVQDERAVCWTKFEIPQGIPGDCCTSGVMKQAASP